jgi:hypothetical protein
VHAPLGHHLDQVTGAELEGEIPSYAKHDDFLVKVPALKELLCRGGFRHRWPLTSQSQLFKFAPEPLRISTTKLHYQQESLGRSTCLMTEARRAGLLHDLVDFVGDRLR